MRISVVLAAVLANLASASVAEAEFFAGRLTEANVAERTLGGMDAIGGIGDWAISNGTLCAVVSDPAHQSNINVLGGALIDLGHCGRDDDQFLLYQELINQSLAEPVPVTTIESEIGEASAALVARGGRPDLEVETRYVVDAQHPTRLGLTTRMTRVAEGPRLMGFSGAFANVRGLAPFGVKLDGAAESSGFEHVTWMGRGLDGVQEAARPLDLVVALGSVDVGPGIAYGQRILGAWREGADGSREDLPTYVLADAGAAGIALFSGDFWIGGDTGLGTLELLQTLLMDLDVGESLVLDQAFWIGDRADVASITDQLHPDAALVSGTVTGGTATVHVDRVDGGPFSERRVEADGRFALRLPAGRYALRAQGEAGRQVTREIEVGHADLDAGTLALDPAARVVLPAGRAMRLVFVGRDGTADPDFGDDLRGARYRGADGIVPGIPPQRDLHLAGTANDPREVRVAPGRYRVLATRGPEWELADVDLVVAAGETTTLAIPELVRAFETPGWVATDLHTHAAPSLDNGTSPRGRVRSLVAEDVDVFVSSEHDNVYDFAPLIREMGLAERLPSLVGIEITGEVKTEEIPHSNGHANAFPIALRPDAYRNGAPPDEGRRWRDVFGDLRANQPTRTLVQLNHARFADRALEPRAYLSHLGPAAAPYDPTRPLDEGANAVLVEPDPATGLRDVDFDAIELLNGPWRDSYEVLREDWFSFLLQGERMTGTANSDSHFLATVAAAPRTYVAQPEGPFDADGFLGAIRDGRVVGTNGPWVGVRLGESDVGDTYRGNEGTLRVIVQAASWIPVSRLRVRVSGQLADEREITAPATVEIPLAFARDGFVTVEVEGDPDDTYDAVLPRHAPLAFTNPIWVDADGDGTWTPPGLPTPSEP